MGQTSVYNESTWDNHTPAQPLNVKKIWQIICQKKNIHKICDMGEITYGIGHAIFTNNFNMHESLWNSSSWSLHLTRSSSVSTCAWRFEVWQMTTQLTSPGLSQVTKVGFTWLWSRGKAVIAAMEEPTFTKTKDGTAGQKCDEKHVTVFLALRALCTGNLLPPVKQWMTSFPVIFWSGWQRMCCRNYRKCGTQL